MLETDSEIQLALRYGGETLTFLGFTVLAIPGSLVYNTHNYASPNTLETQDFEFQMSHKDFLINRIEENDEFSYQLSNSGVTIRFRISSYSVDTTGWCRLNVTPVDYN